MLRYIALILLVLVLALELKLWTGSGGMREVWRLRQHVTEQKQENANLKQRNEALASEVEDLKSGKEVIVQFKETTDWYNSRRINEDISGFKTLVDKETGLLVGAHLLGEHSDEVINLFALAIKFKIPAKDLQKMLFAYPTRSSTLSYMFD